MDYGEFLVCLERRMKKWERKGYGGCSQILHPEEVDLAYKRMKECCTMHEARPIEFEAVVSGMFRGRIEDGVPVFELSGISTEDLLGFPLGTKFKVRLGYERRKDEDV